MNYIQRKTGPPAYEFNRCLEPRHKRRGRQKVELTRTGDRIERLHAKRFGRSES